MSPVKITIPGADTKQIKAVLDLLEEGATIPFISRYRKEMTGGLDELQISSIKEQAETLEALEKRKESILRSIEEQGKLSPELRSQIENCTELNVLEDLYLPYKQKRKTRASVAREKGLEPLAGSIMKQDHRDPYILAERFVKGDVGSVEDAINGALDIMAEWISERAGLRGRLRKYFERQALLESKVVKGKEEEGDKYADYFSYQSKASSIPGHRFLAISRAESEGIVKMSIEPPREEAIEQVSRYSVKGNSASSELVEKAGRDAYMRLIRGSLETEIKNQLKEKAEEEAIDVFAANLRQLLMAPPLGQKNVLAIDPGFRTGCKVVCLGKMGELRHNATIYPHPPQSKSKEAAAKLSQFIEAYEIDAIAIGDGTAGRETEQLVKKQVYKKRPVEIYLVNEDGASVYSASAVAREEFPDYDVSVRGAVSIGRRLMDPLSELVKIDPKSIGVGQYQHDLNPKRMKEKLDFVVLSCVNAVGVELNLASKYLLQHISGLSPTLASRIVEYRESNGPFKSRKELLKVSGLGPKAFEQAAGFLRISDSKEVLDNSAIHPERYELVKKMARSQGIKEEDLLSSEWISKVELHQFVSEEVGMPTLLDIHDEIRKPGRDPRGKARAFEFTSGIGRITDLKEGMLVNGKVTNITKFGAFVDIGIKENGLIHVSEMADRFVSDPLEIVSIGQELKCRVKEIDLDRKRIALSLKDV